MPWRRNNRGWHLLLSMLVVGAMLPLGRRRPTAFKVNILSQFM
jgi:hypothetical protein